MVEEGLQALGDGGPAAVRVEALAKKLGVTKGGFYGYFADRDALLEAMLDAWERESVDEVIDRVEPRAAILGTKSRTRRAYFLQRPPAAHRPRDPGLGRHDEWSLRPCGGGQPAHGVPP